MAASNNVCCEKIRGNKFEEGFFDDDLAERVKGGGLGCERERGRVLRILF